MTITRQEYLNFWEQGRVHNLSAEQLRLICPYIGDSDFHILVNYRAVTAIALPPVRVRSKFKTVTLYRNGYEYELQWVGTDKTTTNANFALEAMAYAKQMWPEELVDDTWIDVMRIELCDPTNPNLYNGPGYITTIYAALAKSWNTIQTNQTFRLLQDWNDALQFATIHHTEGEELMYDHPVYTYYNCALCGGGLSVTACAGCGFMYSPIPNGWQVPLPPKLVNLLVSQGHQFSLEPSRLWHNDY